MLALLVIIYISFISLGLPDSLLGSAWPSMYLGLGVSISSAGAISMIIAGGTIVSSLFSDRLIRRWSTGTVTLVSVATTAVALLGISWSGSFAAICLWAVPLGLGAGSVDAALNNFVALHYRAAHMNWLHSFWGIGASLGPVIMALFLSRFHSWQLGYRAIGVLQVALVAVLAFSLPLWKKAAGPKAAGETGGQEKLGIAQLLRLPKAKQTLVGFFSYCALEMTVGLWSTTYLVVVRGVAADVAAGYTALYYMGITAGRMLSGFLSLRLATKSMIRIGQGLIALGVVALLLPLPQGLLAAGLFLVGLGCAPIYPGMLHETPNTFGPSRSQAIMGIQMACAYTGTTFVPPLFGLLGGWLGYGIFPVFVAGLLLLQAAMVALVYRKGKA